MSWPVALTASSGQSDATNSRRTGTIAFIRQANERGYGGGLFVVRPNGSGLRRVTPPSTTGLLVRLVARRQADRLHRPAALALGGTSGREGTQAAPSHARLSSVALSWSPDGKQDRDHLDRRERKESGCARTTLYVVPVDGGQPVSLRPRKRGYGVAWSPAGKRITYDDARGGISAIRSDGTGRRPVAPVANRGGSADGTRLAFKIGSA